MARTPQKAGEPFTTPVQITPDELIRYIKENAAEQAGQAARERLNFFFTLLGIFLAVVTAIAAGTLFSIREQISSDLENRLKASVENRIASLRDETRSTIREEMGAAILLPLLVADAMSVTGGESYSTRDRDRVLTVLEQIKPEIELLQGPVREIAFRRIEEIITAFNSAGDYFAAYRIYDLFGNEMLKVERIHATMARIFASTILYDRNFDLTHGAAFDRFMSFPYSPDSAVSDTEVQLLLFVREAIGDGVDDAGIVALLAQEEAVRPGFTDALADVARSLRQEFSPGGQNDSPFGLENLDRLEAAILASRDASPSP